MNQQFKVKDPGHFGDCVVGQFDTIDEAIKRAEEVLSEYREGSRNDGEWSYDTEDIRVVQGETVVARAVECDVIERPDDVDEDGYSPSEDLWFNSVDRYCDYKIERVATHPSGGAVMASELKPVKVTIFFPSDMDISVDRASWYLENAIRGHWGSFAHDNDPIRGMARASVAVFPHDADTRPAPAATDTGLETVTYRGKFKAEGQGHWEYYPTPDSGFDPDKYEEQALVTRSQAEELLAAERAEKEEARQSWKEAVAMYEQEKARVDPALKRVSELEADNAAKDARIEELDAAWLSAEKQCQSQGEQLAAAQKALEGLRSDCQVPIDMYERNGPEFTSPHGNEYESTSYVMAKFAELVASIDEARAVLGGRPS